MNGFFAFVLCIVEIVAAQTTKIHVGMVRVWGFGCLVTCSLRAKSDLISTNIDVQMNSKPSF